METEFDLNKLNRPASGKEALDNLHTHTCSCRDGKSKCDCTEQKSRVFETGAVRDSNDDKPFCHNLKGYTRLRFGYHTRLGAHKYGDGNFLKGIPTSAAWESLERHIAKYEDGDRSEDHLSAMIFNIQLIMLNEQRSGMLPDHYFNLRKANGEKQKKV